MSVLNRVLDFAKKCTNIALKILKLKKRNKNIWIFGAWGGHSYKDNSKYLFEYVNKELKSIESVWITKNNDIKRELNRQGFKCYLSNEKEGRKYRLKAGVVFYTNALTDLGEYDLCHGAKKIALWHGMPLKKMFFASNSFKGRKKSLLMYLRYCFLKLYNKYERDFTVATSQKAKKFLMECFELKPNTVHITGQPRNDVFFKQIEKIDTKDENKSLIVLYMPTWRNTKDYESFLDKIVDKLKNDQKFIKYLLYNNIKLYIKPHPNSIVQSISKAPIYIIDRTIMVDSQELLFTADILITDYSSVFIDFALMEKPIHFFVPDLNEYRKGDHGLFLKFSDFSEFWFNDIETLKLVIKNHPELQKKGLQNSAKINNIYNDPRLGKGGYCKNVVDKLVKEYFS